MICCLSVVCRLPMTRVYCDKTTEVTITRFSHNSRYSIVSLTAKFEKVTLIGGLKLGWERGIDLDFEMLYLGNGAR